MADPAQLYTGLSALEAAYAYSTSVDEVTATGTTRANAAQLAAGINFVDGDDTLAGVILPDLTSMPGESTLVFNDSAEDIVVYALASQTIDSVAGATGVPLSGGARCQYWMISRTAWVSALLGAVSA